MAKDCRGFVCLCFLLTLDLCLCTSLRLLSISIHPSILISSIVITTPWSITLSHCHYITVLHLSTWAKETPPKKKSLPKKKKSVIVFSVFFVWFSTACGDLQGSPEPLPALIGPCWDPWWGPLVFWVFPFPNLASGDPLLGRVTNRNNINPN